MKPQPTAPTRRRLLQGAALALLPGVHGAVRANTPAAPLRGDMGAAPPEVLSELPGARLLGSGRLRFMGLRIYDARLWSPRAIGTGDWAAAPLALELEYARSLNGRAIAERSLDEMRRQGDITPEDGRRWVAEMSRLFPDVKEGDRITGLQRPGEATRVFHNGVLRGELRDPVFTRLFFGIWFSDRTSEPDLRAELLGAVAR